MRVGHRLNTKCGRIYLGLGDQLKALLEHYKQSKSISCKIFLPTDKSQLNGIDPQLLAHLNNAEYFEWKAILTVYGFIKDDDGNDKKVNLEDVVS